MLAIQLIKPTAAAAAEAERNELGNAQNDEMTYALDAAFMRAADNDAVGAVVLCGNGKHFNSGHDLSTPRSLDPPKHMVRSGLFGFGRGHVMTHRIALVVACQHPDRPVERR